MVGCMKVKINKNRGSSIRKGGAWCGSHPASSLTAIVSDSDDPLDLYIVNDRGLPIVPKKEIAIVMSGENRDTPMLCGTRIFIDDREAYALIFTEKGNAKNVLHVKEDIWK